MNVYDFDRTIYDGDCTVDFYLYCLKRYPVIYTKLPEVLLFGLLYLLRITSKDEFKSRFFKFFHLIPSFDSAIADFWNINRAKIKKFYLENQREDDVVISASPTYVLREICDILNIKYLFATEVNFDTGKIIGKNCYGKEKVKRFYNAGFEEGSIDEFYSDSLSDSPLAEISKKAIFVIGNRLEPWEKHKK